MKPTYVRPATVADAFYIAANLRPEDRDEVVATTGAPPSLVLPASIRVGREVLVAGIQGQEPQIIFGADPIPGVERAAVIWMVGTPVVFDYPVEFLFNSRKWWNAYHERYDLLTNFSDARNIRHHRWLKWLGAKIIRRIERYGAESRPFVEFASLRCA